LHSLGREYTLTLQEKELTADRWRNDYG
jgi:hypothetical protein